MSKKKLPNLKELELVRSKIKNIPNRKGECLRKIHYGCFLLCLESGLRISEAVRFDLNTRTKKDLYRINKPKKQKKRLVYIPKKVIGELKKQNWQPNKTNRFSFYHFLKKIKRELNLPANTELTPHTLRRAFATYHAETGLPLPLLQKLLGHSSIRTTALYWQNIYGDDDTSDILAGKRWLEENPPRSPAEENLSDNLEPPAEKPIIKPNSPSLKKPVNYQPINEISPKSLTTEIFSPFEKLKEPKEASKVLFPEKNFSPPTIKKEVKPPKIREKFSEQLPEITEKEPTQEEILLKKVRELEEQLAKIRTENNILKIKNKHLKELIRQERGTEAKVIQPLPFKIKN